MPKENDMFAAATYELMDWEDIENLPCGQGLRSTRATTRKRYVGQIEGESVATVLIASADTQRPVLSVGLTRSGGYVAHDYFAGGLQGRTGSFVFLHGGRQDGATPELFGMIVPGTGEGELEGITGTVRFPHDPEVPGRIEITYTLPGKPFQAPDESAVVPGKKLLR